ncbi:MAG: Nif3-like dinuclear metal center hexameric protein [Candidatus Latescibacteria bacterium]|nr:Nif3-like dinuclear metal center hexameric protein [Candidatus Latescibacterota bacterium]
MRAREVMAHFQEIGKWVDWDRTCDRFLHGDSESEVRGIATAWIPTNEAIRRASEQGCTLFITHEPAFYPGYEGAVSADRLVRTKKALLDQLGITLMRCHDTWDRMPEFGIPDAWASFLGFETEERPVESFYKICLLDKISVEQAARLVLEKVRTLGQDTVLVFGNRTRQVTRMAVGTGAITHLPSMYELNADVILATDDGMNFWTSGLWAADLDVPLLIVNHATAEKPGMQAMARYLKTVFPDMPVAYLDVSYPYRSVSCAP